MLVWQLRSAFDSLEQLPLIHHQHLLDLLNNQLLDTKKYPVRFKSCNAALDLPPSSLLRGAAGPGMECCRRRHPPECTNFLCSSECRGRRHSDGSHQHLISPILIGYNFPLFHQTDHENFSSPWICPRIFVGICRSGFLGFVWHFHQHLSGGHFGRGWSNYRVALSRSDSCDYLWVVSSRAVVGRAGRG